MDQPTRRPSTHSWRLMHNPRRWQGAATSGRPHCSSTPTTWRAPRSGARSRGPAPPIAALEARDIPQMLDLAPHAEVILLDALITGGDLRDTLALLRERCPGVPVIVTAGFNDPEAMRAALDGGAISFVLKDLEPRQLRATVEAALDGHGVLDPEVVQPVLAGYATVLEASRRRDRAIIESLAAAVEAKDTVTSDHVHTVGRLATLLARLVEPQLAALGGASCSAACSTTWARSACPSDPQQAGAPQRRRVDRDAPAPADRPARDRAARPSPRRSATRAAPPRALGRRGLPGRPGRARRSRSRRASSRSATPSRR